MKKLLSFTAILALLGTLNAASLDEIKKAGVIKIATEGIHKPYSYHDEKDELTGYDVEIARAVAEKIGVKAEFVEAPWDSLLAGLSAGKSDAVFNQVSITEPRKKVYDFSTPYTLAHGAIVVHKDDESIKSISDIKGKSAASETSSNWTQILIDNGANIQNANSFIQAAELVIAKRAQMLMNDDVTFYDFIKNKPTAPLKIAIIQEQATPAAAALLKGNAELLAAINSALDELFKDGTIAKISQKYFGKDVSK